MCASGRIKYIYIYIYILDIHSSNEGVTVTNIQICITIVNEINYMAELLNTYCILKYSVLDMTSRYKAITSYVTRKED